MRAEAAFELLQLAPHPAESLEPAGQLHAAPRAGVAAVGPKFAKGRQRGAMRTPVAALESRRRLVAPYHDSSCRIS